MLNIRSIQSLTLTILFLVKYIINLFWRDKITLFKYYIETTWIQNSPKFYYFLCPINFLWPSLFRWFCPWQCPEPLAWCLPLFVLQAMPKKTTPSWWLMRYFLCNVFWGRTRRWFSWIWQRFYNILYFAAFAVWHTWAPAEVPGVRCRPCGAGCSISEKDCRTLCFMVSGMLSKYRLLEM